MKQLTDLGLDVMEVAVHREGHEESEATYALLAKVSDKDLAFELDCAIGAYMAAVKEAAFVAGLEAGRNPLAWLLEDRAAEKP